MTQTERAEQYHKENRTSRKFPNLFWGAAEQIIYEINEGTQVDVFLLLLEKVKVTPTTQALLW